MPIGRILRLLLAACALLAGTGSLRAASAAAPDDGGPHHLLITYRAEPRDRPAFRSYLEREGRVPFDRLVKQGALKEYRILFNPLNSSNTWDALIVLGFERYADTKKWNEIERVSPGGLDRKGLKLARPVDSYWADLPWQGSLPGASDRAAGDSIFYVIPYEHNGPAAYRKYVDAYVVPQVEGWMREGVLISYRLYLNRFGTGKPWDALFVYQYKDLQAFGRRDEVVVKVREGLKNDAAWQKLNEIKQTIRTESENTITELVLPR